MPLLQISGTDGMYVTPRSSTKTVDPSFMVILFPGFGLEDAKRQRDLVDDVLGVVRTSKGYEVRVHESKYPSTRRVLFPYVEVSDESDAGGPRRFRLHGGTPHAINCGQRGNHRDFGGSDSGSASHLGIDQSKCDQ